jgi:long-subunit fatty acid transport protein
MNRFTLAVVAATVSTSSAYAGGLDRSNQATGIIFKEGTYAELNFGYVAPSVDGTDRNLGAGAGASGDVADNFFQGSFGYKQDLSDKLSFAIIVDQPYGADIAYPVGGSVNLGGTTATLNSRSITGMLRYKINNRFSVLGGIRAQDIDAAVTLNGAAYGPASGYAADFDGDTGFGYQLGAAYEIPEIALRVAVTYFSEIDHTLDTIESGPGGAPRAAGPDTPLTTPQAVNIDFQTGVAADTLVFGGVRWADYSEVKVRPSRLGGSSLTDIDDFYRLTLGVGRKFSEQFSGAISLTYEEGGDDLVSPLGPTNGQFGLTVGGTYSIQNVELTAGINYTRFGDSNPRTAGATPVAAADFTDNDAIGVGFRIGYSF